MRDLRHIASWVGLCLVAAAVVRAETNALPDPASLPDPTTLRDPFWPVGYSPQTATSSVDTKDDQEVKAGLQFENLTDEQQAIFRKKLKVTGFLKTGKGYVARINNQLVGATGKTTVDFEGQPYTFRVRAISADSVQLEPES